MLFKTKKYFLGIKEKSVIQGPIRTPVLEGSGKEVDLSVLNSEINEQELCAELEKAYAEGKERELLVESADRIKFPSCIDEVKYNTYCDKTQNILNSKMRALSTEEDILKLMENPTEFFQRGWCYPSPYSRIYSYENQGKVFTAPAYVWNFCLDKSFFANPETFYKFYKCALQHFGNKTRSVLNDLDEDLPYAKNDLRKLFKEYFGFKMQIESYAEKQYQHTLKKHSKISKRLAIEPTEEDEVKLENLKEDLHGFARIREFTFKGENLLIAEYKDLCPGKCHESKASNGCGFEIM